MIKNIDSEAQVVGFIMYSTRLSLLSLFATILGCSAFKKSKGYLVYSGILFISLFAGILKWIWDLIKVQDDGLYQRVLSVLLIIPATVTGMLVLALSNVMPKFDASLLGETAKTRSYLTVLKPIIIRLILIFAALITNVYDITLLKSVDLIVYICMFVTSVNQLQFIEVLHEIAFEWDKIIEAISSAKHKSYESLDYLINEATRLTEVAILTNKIFSKQILITLLRSFILLVVYFYSFAGEVRCHLVNTQEVDIFFKHGVHHIIFMTILCYEIWDLLSACENLMTKSEIFSLSLFTMAMEDQARRIYSWDSVKAHFAIRRRNEFTAYNFVPLDFSLAVSIIGSATTYLVLLIQSAPQNVFDDRYSVSC